MTWRRRGNRRRMLSRRRLLTASLQLTGAAALAGCGGETSGGETSGGEPASRLQARPGATPPAPALPAGVHPLPLEGGREILVSVPPGLAPGAPAPLVLTLHGAGGDARGGLDFLQRVAPERGLILLAPASGGSTWDAVRGDYGPDVERIDHALARIFSMLPVRPSTVSVAGFSDGASYALGLGLANGELFGSVLAFSPGFVTGEDRQGKPRVFVSHGVADDVLPIERTSRRIVPSLRRDGYEVRYEEFPDGHTVPPELARQAVDWWVSGR